MFDKERFHVLEKNRELIEKVERSEERTGNLGELKFQPTYFFQSTYIDSRNKVYPEYLLTKDGFTMLVFRYEDDNAIDFQLA